MKVFVPNTIQIEGVHAPASKSYAQRGIVAAMLSNKNVELLNTGKSADVLHILQAIQDLGSSILTKENGVEIIGGVRPPKNQINCGESGLGSRLIISIASLFNSKIEIKGEGSLLNRPMNEFADIFNQLDINFQLENGRLPIVLEGGLTGAEISIDGSLSSQYLSGLLMALPLANGDSLINVKNLKSRPYIDMTISLLKDFGISIENRDYKEFRIKGNQKYNPPKQLVIEGDWSGAAFWIVYGLIKNDIIIGGLNNESLQADKDILQILDSLNVKYKWDEGNLIIPKSKLEPFVFDANHCPDLFPALVVLASSIEGQSTIKGLKRLKHKESDRGEVLKKEFGKLGLKIDLEADEMIIHGTGKLDSGTISSHNDHRIAMAGAIASILTEKGIEIGDSESVNKSYPEFWNVI